MLAYCSFVIILLYSLNHVQSTIASKVSTPKTPLTRSHVEEIFKVAIPNKSDNLTPETVVVTNGPIIVPADAVIPKISRQSKKKIPSLLDNFSEDSPEYPDEKINELLRQLPPLIKSSYNVANTILDRNNVNLTERTGSNNRNLNYNSDDEEAVCRTYRRDVYPDKIDNVYIVKNDKFIQIIPAELCVDVGESKECNYQLAVPHGYRSFCKQKYAYKKLLYMDPISMELSTDLFRYPSCCSCYLKSWIQQRSSLPTSENIQRGNTTTGSESHISLRLHTSDINPTANNKTSSLATLLSTRRLDINSAEDKSGSISNGSASIIIDNNNGTVGDKVRNKSLFSSIINSSSVNNNSYNSNSNNISNISNNNDNNNGTLILSSDKVFAP